MSSTLSLSCSKKLHALLGDTYETKWAWFNNDGEMGMTLGWELVFFGWARETKGYEWHPSPSFSETVRLLPKIAEKKGWNGYQLELEFISTVYATAPTEEKGMEDISEYLEKIL